MQPTSDGQDAAQSGTAVRARVEKNGGGPAQNGASSLASAVSVETVSLSDEEAARAQIRLLSAYFRHSYHMLYGQALGLVASPEVAEDVVQEAFTNTSERIKAGTRINNLNSWLRCCVQNISIKHLRKKPTVSLQEELENGGYVLPADLAYTKSRFEEVCRAIDRLAPAQRSAFIMAEIRGMAHRDIAIAMNRSEGSVRQLISRARSRIREVAGERTLSLVLPMFLAADAEARSHVPITVRARVVRSKLLTGMSRYQAGLRQSLWTLKKPMRIATVFVASSAMVFVLGGSPTDDAVLTGSIERGSLSTSSFSPALKAESKRPVQDISMISSSHIPTVGGTSAISPIASDEAGDSSSGRHSAGRHRLGGTDSLSEESKGHTNAPEQVATIASPGDNGIDVADPSKTPELSLPPDPPLNPPELLSPAVLSGTPHVGETVSCTGDTWSNEPTEILKRWRSNGVSIPGVTGNTYTLVAQDAGNMMDCYVTATNKAGTGIAITDVIWVVGAPVNVTPPTIVGGTHVGDLVECAGATWSGDPGTLSYEWRSNGLPISTSQQIVLAAALVGTKVECLVTATNVVGSDTAVSKSITVT